MGHSVSKQAVPFEFFEQIYTDNKLQTLIDHLWGCGDSMFSWFTRPSRGIYRSLPSPIDEFLQDYKALGRISDDPFESEVELEAYCALLEQRLKQLKADDPFLVQRKVYFGRRTDVQIHSFLLEELRMKFPSLDVEFAHAAIWGGERIKPTSDLQYLSLDQVNAIANVLSQIESDELLSHFNDLEYEPEYWLEECRKTVQEFKICFAETSKRQQIILTKVV